MCSRQEDRLVALLHDTVEDGGITSEYLLMAGFPQEVVDAVLSVSRKRGEDYLDFIQRCKTNPIGCRVKKYHKSYKILNE